MRLQAGLVGGVLLLGTIASAYGQTFPGTIAWQDTLQVGTTRVFVLRPFMLRRTVQVWLDNRSLDTTAYRLDAVQGVLVLADSVQGKRLVVAYRTLPLAVSPVYQHYQARRLPPPPDRSDAPARTVPPAPATPSVASLRPRGRITRGIVTGNRQDLSVASALQLELSGEVADGVTLEALLSDANVPLSPEGTTQRLREFDRVFVRLQTRNGQVQLGDYDLKLAPGALYEVQRKLQGALLTVQWPGTGLVRRLRIHASGAVSKGTYRRQVIVPVEGMQGPYRLTGAAGEPFVLVLPGSERVYLDGRLLDRGTDYVMDYATGELTFTARHLITAERRISVEFEYTTGAGTRSLLASQAQLELGRRRTVAFLEVAALREADGRRFGEIFGLTRADSLALRQAGDGLAVRSGAERVPFDPEAPYVLYTREVRTLPDGSTDTVYVALSSTPPPGTPVYRVTFSRVGPGRGRYVRAGQNVNGIVYVYRGPGQGDYEPVRLLPAPVLHELVGLRARLQPRPGWTLGGEWARSRYDANRLSSLDASDDRAGAYRLFLQIDSVALPVGWLAATLQRQHLGANFAAFSRLQPVEFARRWNLGVRDLAESKGVFVQSVAEITDEARLDWQAGQIIWASLELGQMHRPGQFRGVRQAFRMMLGREARTHFRYHLEKIRSRHEAAREQGHWLRQEGRLAVPLGAGLTSYLEGWHEDRRQRALTSDSLRAGSLAYLEVRPGLLWQHSSWHADLSIGWRREEEVWRGQRLLSGRIWTLQGRLQYAPGPRFRTTAALGYRRRRTPPRFAEQFPQDQTLAVQWNGFFRSRRQLLRLNWRYRVQSERAPVLQEVYVRTGPEFGQYVWEDFNGDGVPQVDEFVPETLPDEGIYERVLVPSDSLTSATAIEVQMQWELLPGRRWEVLRPLTLRTTVELRDRTRDPALRRLLLLDPAHLLRPDATLDGRLRLIQDVYLWRGHSARSITLSMVAVRALAHRATGREERRMVQGRLQVRFRVTRQWEVGLEAEVQRDRQFSEGLRGRTYRLHRSRLRVALTRRLLRGRASGALVIGRGQTQPQALRLWTIRMPLEAEQARPGIGRIRLRLDPAYVWQQGTGGGLAGYLLAEGLTAGWNVTWGVELERTLSDNLELTFGYHGRLRAAAPFRHTLRVELSAVF
ncbi:hypothetical protein [Rhodothermus profundi]|uniref:Cell surface protein SprA n=1 Tax=Rhodothermus profundi TaxID=633813 RepID=A0A1M6Q2K2_9BACT|nr:hypothetical protein [Rhodothermus profundi]SHK14347.1 cell surface protein SprA [Rhodothermus profundi]